MLLKAVLFIVGLDLVECSGHLLVGFLLYEFRHNPIIPADITGQELSRVNLTSQHNDVITNVTVWSLRTVQPGQKLGQRGGSPGEAVNMEGEGGGDSLWIESLPCNESSSTRPRYHFLLCLDYLHSRSNATACPLGKVQLSSLAHFGTLDRDLVTFPSALGMTSNGLVTSNPMIFGFSRWRGSVLLKVHVRCCPAIARVRGQCEETFSYTIHHTPAHFALPLSPQNVMLSGRGRLVLSMKLQCDEDYYGTQCDVHCRVDPSVEHAFCNVTSGEKHCMPGWTGRECQIDTNECRYHHCRNGAHCVNSPPGSFTCQCPLGFVGRLCQRRMPVCHTIPCKHGGSCHDTSFGFVCFCPRGFAGTRCERQLFATDDSNVTSSLEKESFNVGKSAQSEDLYIPGLRWEKWQSAVVVGGCFFIVLVIVVCCLLRGRLHKLRAKRSFYRLFITTKSYDNVVFESDELDDSFLSHTTIDDDLHTYQNVFSPSTRQSATSSERDDQDHAAVSIETRRTDLVAPYMIHFPSPLLSQRNPSQYEDVNSLSVPSRQGKFDSLPNLVDPKKSPLLVHRDLFHPADLSLGPRAAHRHASLRLLHHPRSESTAVPRLMVTQHYQPSSGSGTFHFLTSTSESCGSNTSLPEQSRRLYSRTADFQKSRGRLDSPKSVIRSRVRDVYTIEGSLSTEDITGASSPRLVSRKSLLESMAKRNKSSEPKLCSIRRVDSCGYEIPVRYSSTNHYTRLCRSRMEDHMYDKISPQETARLGQCRQQPHAGDFPQKGPKDGQNRGKSMLSADCRASVLSEVGRYVELTEHVSDNPAMTEQARSGGEDRSLMNDVHQNEVDRVQVGKSCLKKRRGNKIDNGQHDISRSAGLQQTQWHKTLGPHRSVESVDNGQQVEADSALCGHGDLLQAQTASNDENSDDNSYEEVLNPEADEKMWSNCDYIDVFIKTRAAV